MEKEVKKLKSHHAEMGIYGKYGQNSSAATMRRYILIIIVIIRCDTFNFPFFLKDQ